MQRGNAQGRPAPPGPRDRSRRYAEGVRLYKQRLYVAAVEAMDDVLRLGDGRRDAPRGLLDGMAAYYRGMSQRAMGLAALREGRLDEAERLLRAAARELGPRAGMDSYLCRLYARESRHEACAAEAGRAAEADESSPAAVRRHALALWRSGQREEAYQVVSSGLRRLGERAELLVQMGLFLSAEGRLAEARETLSRAAAADCTCGDAHYYLGLAAAAQGDMPAAARAWSRAIEFRGDDLVLAHQLAMAAAEAERQGLRLVLRLPEPSAPPDAPQARELARYIALEPDFLEACLSLKAGDADTELLELLRAVVRIALAEHPRYADLHYQHARILARLGLANEAVAAAGEAVRINPGYAKALLLLGELHADGGRAEDAARVLARAVAAGADWPDVHVRTAGVLARLGRSEKARGHLRRALELNQGYSPASEALSALAA